MGSLLFRRSSSTLFRFTCDVPLSGGWSMKVIASTAYSQVQVTVDGEFRSPSLDGACSTCFKVAKQLFVP